MSIPDPVRSVDLSSNNAVDVRRLPADCRIVIERVTGGLDKNAAGRWVPWIDKSLPTFDKQLSQTDKQRGLYYFPVSDAYIDLDRQIEISLNAGPANADGYAIAMDYERYGPRPDATILPDEMRYFSAAILKEHPRNRWLMYAGHDFWLEPPHSGTPDRWTPGMRFWQPWYFTNSVIPDPWAHYAANLADSGWFEETVGLTPVAAQIGIGRYAGAALDINAFRIPEETFAASYTRRAELGG